MTISTDVPAVLGSLAPVDPEVRRQGLARKSFPIGRTSIFIAHTTTGHALDDFVRSVVSKVVVAPPKAQAELPRDVVINGTPLEVWEGVVKELDSVNGTMTVYLDAKISKMPRHTAEIELEWVTEQDRDLVSPGAVFYLTLFKRTSPSVENAQELRFRRRPSWTDAQISQVAIDAAMIQAKMKALPTAE